MNSQGDEPDIQFSWDIDVPGVGSVWLRGEDSTGHPTQTWINGVLIEREPEGVFAWETEAGVPTPIYMMDQTVANNSNDAEHLCYVLGLEVAMWEGFERRGQYSEGFRARCAAYAHCGRVLRQQHGC